MYFNVFSLFCSYFPFEKERALLLNYLESPSPKDALCQVWFGDFGEGDDNVKSL